MGRFKAGVRLLGSVALVWQLAGCGGGGGGAGSASPSTPAPPAPPPPPALVGDYFPLSIGSTWTYQASDTTVERLRVVRGGGNAGNPWVLTTGSPQPGGREERLERRSDGLYSIPTENDDALFRALGTTLRLRLPIVLGDTYVLFDRTLPDPVDQDNDGKVDSVGLRAESTVVGEESTLPIPDARSVKVRTVLTQRFIRSSGAPTLTVTITSEDWYAPEIGLIRSLVRYETAQSTRTEESWLSAFRVGSLKSETKAPTVVELLPAAESTASAQTIQLKFSENMDRLVDMSGSLRLTDPNGKAVPVGLQWLNQQTVRVQPLEAWISGRYQLQVTNGFEDWAGNGLVLPPNLAFNVDLTGPQILRSEPANGAVDVPIDAVLRITLDEDVPAANASPLAVQLSGRSGNPSQESGGLPSGTIGTKVSLQGRVLEVRPNWPLVPGNEYILSLNTSDLYGNVSNPSTAQIRFRTANGRFTSAQSAPGLGPWQPSQLIVGDFNGDGRQDWIAKAIDPSPTARADWRLFGINSAGNFTQVSLSALSGLDFVSLIRTDLDGDGRDDLVTVGTFGVQWLQQDPAGQLQARGRLVGDNAGGLNSLRVAADGNRTGLLVHRFFGAPRYAGGLALYRQTAVGVWDEGTALPHGLFDAERVAVGDLNQDGLSDVVVIGQFQMVALLQQPDGRFARGSTLALPSENAQPIQIRIADIDGDGKAEVLLLASSSTGGLVASSLQADMRWSPLRQLAPIDATSFALADLDADGRNELITSSFGRLRIYALESNGGLRDQGEPACRFALDNIAVADLNGDGRLDLVGGAEACLQNGGVGPSAIGGSWRQRLSQTRSGR